jgi:hypothetical protein
MSSDSASSRPKYPRPSVVTLSCVFVAVTAFLTLTELVSALMDWATVDMQAWVRPILRQLAEAGAVLTMPEVLQYLRWAFLVMVPFSVAAMVFAVYALRGDRTARVMTTVLAVVAGIVSLPIGIFGVIQAAMLFAAASALWTSDARRWYRGEAPPEAPPTTVAALTPPGPTSDTPTSDPAAAIQAPTTQSDTRPTSVMLAGLLAILGSLVAAGVSVIFLAVHTSARGALIEAFQNGPFGGLSSEREVELAMQISFWASAVSLPLAVGGIFAGVALLAEQRIGRIATLWWAWMTAALALVMIPPVLFAVPVIVLLLRDDARRWTASRGGGGTDNLTA